MTKIEWCDETANPIVSCSKCSPGCDNCYAERRAAILSRNPNPKIRAKYTGVVDANGKWTGRISEPDLSVFERLPKTPKRVFVGSMTDMFHENVHFEVQGKIFSKIAHAPQHTFLMLTKRPVLLQIPAAKRFVSIEPMLGPVDLWEWLWEPTGQFREHNAKRQLEFVKAPGIDWIICGGETGPKARPAHPDWFRGLRDQCVAAGVPFFFKNFGEWTTDYTYDDAIRTPGAYVADTPFARVGKKAAGRLLDGVLHNNFPSGYTDMEEIC